MAPRVTSFRRAGHPEGKPFDFVVLDAEARHLRRKLVTLSQGGDVLVDLDKAAQLQHGDRLVLEDGRQVEVVAAAEDLTEVQGRDAAHLARLAWHIGNRHLPAQVEASRILIRRDRVIAAMLLNLGAKLRDVTEPFMPEHGAYHSHDH
jgi:urease accessory protein